MTTGKTTPSLISALTGPVGDSDPSFLHDLDTDRLVGAVFALTAELWVMKDRQTRLERLLERAGSLASGSIEALGDTPDESHRLTAEAEQFAARILGELMRSKTPTSSVGGARRNLDK